MRLAAFTLETFKRIERILRYCRQWPSDWGSSSGAAVRRWAIADVLHNALGLGQHLARVLAKVTCHPFDVGPQRQLARQVLLARGIQPE
jgi:hypothetical protein